MRRHVTWQSHLLPQSNFPLIIINNLKLCFLLQCEEKGNLLQGLAGPRHSHFLPVRMASCNRYSLFTPPSRALVLSQKQRTALNVFYNLHGAPKPKSPVSASGLELCPFLSLSSSFSAKERQSSWSVQVAAVREAFTRVKLCGIIMLVGWGSTGVRGDPSARGVPELKHYPQD